MDDNRKQELAFLYVQGGMESEEKTVVFGLILNDAQFREMLKEEVELSARMKCLQAPMPRVKKTRLLTQIKQRHEYELEQERRERERESEGWLQWSEWALHLTLPPAVFPIMKLLQRRVFS